MEFLQANMAPVMFVGLFIFLLMGYSVAFSLAACGLFFAFIGIELGMLPASLMQALPLRIFGIMKNDTLLAIPFFTFMGLILERSGMAEDLLDTIGQLFGPLRGGLAIAVILVGAMLAATTGVVAASVISMGLISLPLMLRYGYDRRLASGVIAASGTLAQIIPPSLVLIVIADQLGRSVGDLYAGAFIPGFMLMALYVGWVVLLTFIKPNMCPALPPEARTFREANGSSGMRSVLVLFILSVSGAVAFAQNRSAEAPKDETIVLSMCVGIGIAFMLAMLNRVTKLGLLSRMAERVTFVLIPPLALIFLVLGTIFLGIATPTEGGAMGAVGALIMAFSRRRLSLKLMTQAMDATTKLSAFVMFILLGATVFSLTFQAVDGHKWVEHLLTGLPGGQVGFLIVVNVLIFVLAFFLDFFELAFIVLPLLAPVADKLGIDLVWFGILMAVNMQTSFMHPPFGFALFYLRSVAPQQDYIDKVTKKKTARVTTGQIYWGAVPFVVIQVIMVGVLIAFPGIVTGSLDKTEKLSAEEVKLEMEASGGVDRGYGSSAAATDWGRWVDVEKDAAGDAKPADLDALAPPQDAKEADGKQDDPAAALMEEVAKDKKKGK
ncbi:MAG: TRAP transporter large permease subunit [Gammaproteobacteria bacterium]|nr:TRAP transporter large permease subunit [Rhodocyclaceae bacterium]MBU3908293.1 TRAP transporter large permease subunit [Gammaproteobacteria bacterium]MBU3988745.1 TRAP transporter large permease subunit [Gammaproteobacteria bacterium]MBU4003070.1 TRAP transporter large permease subunit [Gammaproteobacteria bacterium]MBU4019912.1 TRAP transporter large permease subunit [Gammaproteobacteria bacterium]